MPAFREVVKNFDSRHRCTLALRASSTLDARAQKVSAATVVRSPTYSVQRGARERSLSGFSLPPYRETGNPGPESQFVVRILDFSGQCRPAVLGDFWQNQKKFISQDSALAKKSRKCESGPSSHFLVPIPAFSTDKAGWGALQEKDIATASSTLRAALCPTGAFRSDRGGEVHPGK